MQSVSREKILVFIVGFRVVRCNLSAMTSILGEISLMCYGF